MAAIDGADRLHLVFSNSGGIYYSHAQVTEAYRPQAWSPQAEIASPISNNAYILSSPEGKLFVFYCHYQQTDYAIGFTRSNNGEDWSEPVDLSEYTPFGPLASCSTRAALDSKGRLHLVYHDDTALYYLRSEDDGLSWSIPHPIDTRDARFSPPYSPVYGSIIARAADEIHIIWDGAPAGQRWHTVSYDGGITWSAMQQLDPNLRGLTWPAALVVDSNGSIQMLTMALGEDGAYSTQWKDGAWSHLEHIGPGSENPTLAIINGNQLFGAWWWQHDNNPLSIWVSSRTLDSPGIPSQPAPTSQQPFSTLTATLPEPSATLLPTLDPRLLSAPRPRSISSQAILWSSIVPVLALVLAVLLIYFLRRR
jgi:hypothetical protein